MMSAMSSQPMRHGRTLFLAPLLGGHVFGLASSAVHAEEEVRMVNRADFAEPPRFSVMLTSLNDMQPCCDRTVKR